MPYNPHKRRPLLQRRPNDPPSFLDDARPRPLHGINSNVTNQTRMSHAKNKKRSFEKTITVTKSVTNAPPQRKPLATLAINSDLIKDATKPKAPVAAPVAAAPVATTGPTTATATASKPATLASAPDSSADLEVAGPTESEVITVCPSNVTVRKAKQQPQQSKVDDIDERHNDEPLMVTADVKEMYTWLREREIEFSVEPTYMANQPRIDEEMRGVLIDWLIEVHFRLQYAPETLFLAVNLIDRYLEKVPVELGGLQLVGATCLLIACKYEETAFFPDIPELARLCAHAYTGRQILRMEKAILETLGYQVTVPSAHAFLARYLRAAHASKKMIHLACYLLEGTLLNCDLLQYLPSQLACAAVMIARKCAGRKVWSPTLLNYTEYREEDIAPVARAVLEANMSQPRTGDGRELNQLNKKYARARLSNVPSVNLPVPGRDL